ncbi:hypothetical protein BD769DRAFT_1674864 [Suillus cothurnatus]|nr:hypothetical protein BD769DRAFT_1674864 [Suillus cothurnatus]
MHNTLTAVSPFYDQEPGAPPPFPPMLTDRLILFSSPRHSTMLITDEILLPKPKNILAPEFKLTTCPSKNTDHLFSPYLKSGSLEHSHSWTPIPSDSSTSLDSLSDSDLSTSASLSEDSKIPKPPGEPEHPGHGGYMLCEALDWSPKAYSKFNNSMHHLIEEHLDTLKYASSQSPILLKTVCNKAVDAFPNLENYSEFWPVNDVIMMRLKYTSGRARQKEAGMAMGKSKRHTPKAKNCLATPTGCHPVQHSSMDKLTSCELNHLITQETCHEGDASDMGHLLPLIFKSFDPTNLPATDTLKDSTNKLLYDTTMKQWSLALPKKGEAIEKTFPFFLNNLTKALL